jgi:hypothetical protein
MRRVVVVIVAAAASLACGRGEPRFDMQHPPAWLQRLDRIGSNVRPDEIRGDCFQRFTGRCTAEVLPSRALLRRAVLRLAVGVEAQLSYTPAEGSPLSLTIDPRSDAKLRVRKSGGTFVIDCTQPMPAAGCQLVLVSEEQ